MSSSGGTGPSQEHTDDKGQKRIRDSHYVLIGVEAIVLPHNNL